MSIKSDTESCTLLLVVSSTANKSYKEKKWTPLKASKDNVEISHLFFANGLLLFAKANVARAKAIKEALDKFCEESGQLVSTKKILNLPLSKLT